VNAHTARNNKGCVSSLLLLEKIESYISTRGPNKAALLTKNPIFLHQGKSAYTLQLEFCQEKTDKIVAYLQNTLVSTLKKQFPLDMSPEYVKGSGA